MVKVSVDFKSCGGGMALFMLEEGGKSRGIIVKREYVFVYDASGKKTVKSGVASVPATMGPNDPESGLVVMTGDRMFILFVAEAALDAVPGFRRMLECVAISPLPAHATSARIGAMDSLEREELDYAQAADPANDASAADESDVEERPMKRAAI